MLNMSKKRYLIDDKKLMSEWDEIRNKEFEYTPEKLLLGSKLKIWWRCSDGHSWEAAIYSRANGSRCPYCTGLYPIVGENDLLTTHPKLIQEWDYEKNILKPTQVKAGSHKKVWWKCANKHSWESSISSRAGLDTGCPYCSGLKAIVGVNDLSSLRPELTLEWDFEKNRIDIKDVMLGTMRKVWWKCSKGHSYEASVASRARLNSGCPYCAGQKPIKGINDLETLQPLISKEWDYEKNNKLMPCDVTEKSGKKVWWKCSNGHSYASVIASRTGDNHTGCPFCAGQKVLVGFNDLASNQPELAKEWCYEKNGNLLPTQITSRNPKKVWWKCPKGHSYQAVIYNRIEGDNCPICSNHLCVTGINDFATQHPELLKEWNYQKNKNIYPTKIVSGSAKKVWWICEHCSNEWEASIVNRSNGTGCPKCNERSKTSFPEQAIFYYIKKQFSDAINSYKAIFTDSNMEIDIYIPTLKVGIEYDGMAWHISEQHNLREIRKYEKCKEYGIKLIRIKENREHRETNSSDVLIHTDVHCTTNSLKKIFEDMYTHIGVIQDINLERDRNVINEQYYSEYKERSVGLLFPKLEEEWHKEKNGRLTAFMYLPGSTEKVWWECSSCGYEWEAIIESRTKGTGCPKCAHKSRGKQIVAQRIKNGENTIAKKAPWMVSEWNYDKNFEMNPDNTAPQSGKKVWWICTEGHEWEEIVQCRFLYKRPCPYCSGRWKKYKEKKLRKLYNHMTRM